MKRVIVTGAAGGIGYSVIDYLKDQGFFVYALDIKEIKPMANVKSFVCDLTKKQEIEKVFQTIKDEGKIDAIIHLSGIYYMDSLIEIDEQKLKAIFDINFFSVYLVNKIFIDIVNKKGKIVIISSEVAPLDPLPFNGIYSLTKNTLENYALSLRQELNLLDINVVVVRPGAINTGMIQESLKNVERIEKESIHYKENAKMFTSIVKRNESKTIEPIKVAILIKKILLKKHPKLLYSINLNFKLKLLSALPKKMQLSIIKKLISPKHRKEC